MRRLRSLLDGVVVSAVCAAVGMATSPAFAHTTYFGDHDATEGIPLWFDHPETDPFGAGPGLPYDSSRVERVEGFTRLGNSSATSIIDRGTGISVIPEGDDLAALVASVDTGFIVVTPDGERLDLTKAEAQSQGKEFVSSFRAFQSAKAIYDWSDSTSQPFDLPLEIVSLQDPFSLSSEEELPVQILLEGQPTAGALIEYGGEEFITGDEGLASVPFSLNDFRTVEASFVRPLDNDPNADELNYSTTLMVQNVNADVESVSEPLSLAGIVMVGLLLPLRKYWQRELC